MPSPVNSSDNAAGSASPRKSATVRKPVGTKHDASPDGAAVPNGTTGPDDGASPEYSANPAGSASKTSRSGTASAPSSATTIGSVSGTGTLADSGAASTSVSGSVPAQGGPIGGPAGAANGSAGGTANGRTPQSEHAQTALRALGDKLRDARIEAGYTSQDALAHALNVDRSVVTKAESGNRVPGEGVLRKLCKLVNLDYEQISREAKKARAAQGIIPTWFETFREVELVAHTLRAWHPILVPGPLQTPDYARALFIGMGENEKRVEELVTARIERQQILDRSDPPAYLAVMDEAVLRRQVGSVEVIHRQLMHLIEQGQRQHISIQVVPASSGANAGCVGAFTIASVAGTQDVLLYEAVEDVTTVKRSAVLRAHGIFDRVRSDALSRKQSLELIREVAEQCKP